MKVEKKNILEINDLSEESICAIKGCNIDYVLVNKELEEEFLKSVLYFTIIPMVKSSGKILYI